MPLPVPCLAISLENSLTPSCGLPPSRALQPGTEVAIASNPRINIAFNWFEELKQRVPTGRQALANRFRERLRHHATNRATSASA